MFAEKFKKYLPDAGPYSFSGLNFVLAGNISDRRPTLVLQPQFQRMERETVPLWRSFSVCRLRLDYAENSLR